MWALIEYLKEPFLVAKIQEIFGVKHKSNIKSNSLSKTNLSIINKLDNKNSKIINDSKFTEDYIIENKFWYYLFLIGTSLGDEFFYASFIPFWFWNIDGAVGRRFVFVWTIVMYIGQSFKDVIKWPRPSYPVIRLQKKWAEEYGMPSTHAMVAVTIPFSIIFFTMNRYIYSLSLGIICCLILSSIICLSRLYLGMHTVLDIIVGLILAIILMFPMVPTVDYLDYFWIFSPVSPAILFIISIAAIYFFPHTDHWTPTRGDTTMIISVCVGIHIGSWINFKVGNMLSYPNLPPHKILWPDYYMLGLGVIRTILGFALILATRNIVKTSVIYSLSKLLSTTPENVKKKNFDKKPVDIFIELAANYATYFFVGFNLVYAIPIVFRLLRIERPTFYTEM